MTKAEALQGVRQALAEEEKLRDYSYLEAPYIVAGIQIPALTLRSFNLLCIAGNPYVCGGSPTKAQAIQLLWIANEQKPWYRKLGFNRREKFIKRLANRIDVFSGVNEYITEMFLDAPGSSGGNSVSIAASAAYIVHRIATNYHWPEPVILDLTLPRMYQYLKLIRRESNPKAPSCNKLSDAAWVKFHEAINAKEGVN